MEIYSKKNFKLIIKRLENDKNSVFIIPTDTIYGISAPISALNVREKINKLKKRPKNRNLIVLVDSLKQASELGELSKEDVKILKQPYPTTVICKLQKKYKKNNISSDHTIALRIVKNRFVKKLIKKIGPIFSTSANLNGEKYIGSLENFKQILVDFIIYTDSDPKAKTESEIYNSFTKNFIRKINK